MQVELEQNRSEAAMETIGRAKRESDCAAAAAAPSGGSALLCVRILTQEADISREAGLYADAAEVSL